MAMYHFITYSRHENTIAEKFQGEGAIPPFPFTSLPYGTYLGWPGGEGCIDGFFFKVKLFKYLYVYEQNII